MPEYGCIYKENFLDLGKGIAIMTVGSDARRENPGKTSPLEIALVVESSSFETKAQTTREELTKIPGIFKVVEIKYLDSDFYNYHREEVIAEPSYRNNNYPSRVIDAEFISGDYQTFRLMKVKFDTFLHDGGKEARNLINKEKYRMKYFNNKLDEAMGEEDYFKFDQRDVDTPSYRDDMSLRIKMTALRLMQSYVTFNLMQLIREGVIDTIEIPHQTDKRFVFLYTQKRIPTTKDMDEYKYLYKYFLKKYIQGKKSKFFDPGREPDFRKNLERLKTLFE